MNRLIAYSLDNSFSVINYGGLIQTNILNSFTYFRILSHHRYNNKHNITVTIE